MWGSRHAQNTQALCLPTVTQGLLGRTCNKLESNPRARDPRYALFKNGEAARRTPVHRSACHVEGKRIPAVGPLLLDNCTPAIWFSFRTSSRHRPAAGDTSQRHTNHATTTETPSCASPAQRGRLGRVLGAPRLCSPCTKCASAQPPSPLPKASMTHLRQDGQQGRPSRRFVLKGAVRG